MKDTFLISKIFSVLILQAFATDLFGQTFESYTKAIPGTDVDIEMIAIDGGTFIMGSNPEDAHHSDDENPAHEVEVSSFWMGKFEITWDQYEIFMRQNFVTQVEVQEDVITQPSSTDFDPSFGMGRSGYPAVSMTEFAALAFTRWLSKITGDFYRLPTEAEWEYACRAGTVAPYSFGDDVSKLNKYGWYYENSDVRYQKVGSKKPNPWGLYDMHGNVAEWTLDQYVSDFYSKHDINIIKDPWSEPKNLYPRTVRGGSWNDDPEQLRCASRVPSDPERWKRSDPQIPKSLWWNTDSPFVGFRIIRPLEQPSVEEREKFWEKTLEQFYYE